MLQGRNQNEKKYCHNPILTLLPDWPKQISFHMYSYWWTFGLTIVLWKLTRFDQILLHGSGLRSLGHYGILPLHLMIRICSEDLYSIHCTHWKCRPSCFLSKGESAAAKQSRWKRVFTFSVGSPLENIYAVTAMEQLTADMIDSFSSFSRRSRRSF